jgi:hypothetical protein
VGKDVINIIHAFTPEETAKSMSAVWQHCTFKNYIFMWQRALI